VETGFPAGQTQSVCPEIMLKQKTLEPDSTWLNQALIASRLMILLERRAIVPADLGAGCALKSFAQQSRLLSPART
jgi:hypothetical protein